MQQNNLMFRINNRFTIDYYRINTNIKFKYCSIYFYGKNISIKNNDKYIIIINLNFK